MPGRQTLLSLPLWRNVKVGKEDASVGQTARETIDPPDKTSDQQIRPVGLVSGPRMGQVG